MKRFFIAFAAVLLLWCTGMPAAPRGGDRWTEKVIADGIVLYSYSGTEEITGAPQRVWVIDWDMSNPSYALRYTWSDNPTVTSDVFRRENAVATLNGAYEITSVVSKIGGHMYTCMPYDTVMTTPVPNWKSEAAIYTDNSGRNVAISFDGKGLSIPQQREFYSNSTWDNILTSAPMLIDDYSPVGAFFVDSTLTVEQLEQYDYEDPVRHQGVRHPRTAVAITEDNHFLMFAVDGRRPGVSEGMSARELTRFIESNFHPRYALNMDGGGSTTLCVRGEGEPETHVVNYPSKGKNNDHKGERKLVTHISIVETPKAPRKDVRGEVLSDWYKSSGLDCVLSWGPKPSTPAPKGYEATYISHYGRHGSRYAYTSKAYTVLLEMLREADEADNLTPEGQKLLSDLEPFWKEAEYRVGDLTEIGWEQHRQIAKTMVASFPKAFGKGSNVDACSSASTRAIVSMSSFIASIARESPKTDIYAHQSKTDIQATRPNEKGNPFRYPGPDTVFPYAESSREFFLRRFPEYEDVLSLMLKDPVKGLGERDPFDVFFNLYMFVGGMNSVPEDIRIDVDWIFTREQYATLWEIDNYERFYEYLSYRTPCSSIVDDIVAKADERLSAGSHGADLRFGHDHIVMSLLMIMDIDDFGKYPSNPDDLATVFQTFRSPMAANIQIVFYTPKKRGSDKQPLVKVLLNGEEARFGSLPAYDGPYYRWDELREYLLHRVSLYSDRVL